MHKIIISDHFSSVTFTAPLPVAELGLLFGTLLLCSGAVVAFLPQYHCHKHSLPQGHSPVCMVLIVCFHLVI